MTDTVQIPIVPHPEQVTPEWLTSVLRRAGVLTAGEVTGIESEYVGTGQVGDSVRFRLTYDAAASGDGGAPPTVVGKFPTEDETSRSTATQVRTYEIETRFYQQLAHRVDITIPTPYFADIDMASHDFTIIMNDLAPAVQGDQIDGCTVDEAALAVEEVAKLHAPVWGDPSLKSMGWLNRNGPDGPASYKMLLDMLWPGFLERYEGRVHDDVVDAGQQLISRLEAYLSHRPEPHTAAHGDYRVDNMLFGTAEGGAPLTTVDWQTVALGPGVSDVSYFLGTSVLPEVRAEEERDLLKEYHRTLQAGGVRDYPFEQCWEDYRRFAFAGFLMAVISSMIVGRTDRGDEMFMAMANRSGRMALDLETLTLF